MPRKPREKSDTGIYHAILRGVNRQNIFEDDEDRLKFIDILNVYKPISEYVLYGYCLMSNHVHLLIKETNEPISNSIKRISSSYVRWFNKKHDRTGHLFQERFKSEVVEDEQYFLTVLRYIHQNPVKAGMVKNAGQYSWSSFHDYVNDLSALVDIDFALTIISKNRDLAKHMFVEYMNEGNVDQCLDADNLVSDYDVIEFMQDLGIKSVSELQQLDKKQRNVVIKEIKRMRGVTVRQIARVTGISKSVIDRIQT